MDKKDPYPFGPSTLLDKFEAAMIFSERKFICAELLPNHLNQAPDCRLPRN